MQRQPAVEGELLPPGPGRYRLNPAAFDWECGRLVREVVAELGLGYDPLAVTQHVAHIILDPWSNPESIPHYGTAPVRPSPALMPNRRPALGATLRKEATE